MHILVIDGGHVEAEFREKFGPAHEYRFFYSDGYRVKGWDKFANRINGGVSKVDVAFCFSKLSHSPDTYNLLQKLMCPVFFEILWSSLILSKKE